jgi:hypothetical protein
VKEFRILKRGYSLMPIGENFIFSTTTGSDKEGYKSDISIYSYSRETDLKFIKSIYTSKWEPGIFTSGKLDYPLIRGSVNYLVYDDKIFLADSNRGIYAEIFSKTGDKIGKIDLRQFAPQEVTEQFKKEFMELAKASPYYESSLDWYNFYFPKYYPGFDRFAVDKGKLYFLTYNRKGDQRKLIITDWKGAVLKQTYVPWVFNDVNINFSIENDKFYYVKENDETEEWELYVTDIK